MNDRRATSENEVARPVYGIVKYTYYETKAFSRLGGVARCLGLHILDTKWDPASHTATILFGVDEERCRAFIDSAAKCVRKARYECVSGGVKVHILPTEARQRTHLGTDVAHQPL